MRQLYAMLRKEFGSYFEGYAAYFILFIYAFASIGTALYFGSYFEMQDTAMYSLFYIQPMLLIVLLPVLTMKSWSEEYKTGTAEVFLTQPVSDIKMVFSKVFSIFIFSLIMFAATIPFVVYSGKWLFLDRENIFICYVGLILVAIFLICFGCFVSALCSNIILAYLISVFAVGMWLIFPYGNFYPTYNNFLFAEVGVGDIIYFCGFALCFFLLNVYSLQFRRCSGDHSTLKFAAIILLLYTGTCSLVASFFYLLPDKYDFTSSKLYTLKYETKELISHLSKPVTVDVYLAKDYQKHNALYRYYAQTVERMLDKYEMQSYGLIKVNYTVVEPFSDLEKEILESGIYYKQNAAGSYDYFGAIIRDDQGYKRLIKQFLYEREPFVEKDMDMALLQLAKSELIKNIGVYLDIKQNIDAYEGFFLKLENDYSVTSVKDSTYEISPQMDLLILINPKTLPEHLLYAIDQYVMRGGKVLIFLDVITRMQSDETNTAELDAVKLLDKWGIVVHDYFSDKGIADLRFNPLRKRINIYKALSFDVENPEVKVQPVIKDGADMIAFLLEGKLYSYFDQNLNIKEKFAANMSAFVGENEDAHIAVIGDADIIDDDSWIDIKSGDKNPYSAVTISANGEVVKSMVDFMVGNEIYNLLPINSAGINQRSISELINLSVYGDYAEELTAINNDLQNMRYEIYKQSSSEIDKMQKLLNISSAGQQIAHQEKMLEQIQYNMKQEYAFRVNLIIFVQLFVFPLIYIAVLWIIFRLFGARKRRKIVETFNG